MSLSNLTTWTGTSVANLAALAGFNDVPCANGEFAYVASNDTYYRIDRNATSGAVRTKSQGGYWTVFAPGSAVSFGEGGPPAVVIVGGIYVNTTTGATYSGTTIGGGTWVLIGPGGGSGGVPTGIAPLIAPPAAASWQLKSSPTAASTQYPGAVAGPTIADSANGGVVLTVAGSVAAPPAPATGNFVLALQPLAGAGNTARSVNAAVLANLNQGNGTDTSAAFGLCFYDSAADRCVIYGYGFGAAADKYVLSIQQIDFVTTAPTIIIAQDVVPVAAPASPYAWFTLLSEGGGSGLFLGSYGSDGEFYNTDELFALTSIDLLVPTHAGYVVSDAGAMPYNPPLFVPVSRARLVSFAQT